MTPLILTGESDEYLLLQAWSFQNPLKALAR